MLCFIDIENIQHYKKIILERLGKEKNMNSFINYLNNYLFKLNLKFYNYKELINHFESIKSDRFMEKFYTTNNICESLNSKINFFLPKKTIDNKAFMYSLKNIFLNSLISKQDTIRKDYITKGLMLLIKEKEINKNFHWVVLVNLKNI